MPENDIDAARVLESPAGRRRRPLSLDELVARQEEQVAGRRRDDRHVEPLHGPSGGSGLGVGVTFGLRHERDDARDLLLEPVEGGQVERSRISTPPEEPANPHAGRLRAAAATPFRDGASGSDRVRLERRGLVP